MCVCVSTCMVDGCLRVVVVSGKYLNVFVNNYSTAQKKPNRERAYKRVQNGYENGIGMEQIQNGY